MANQIGHDDFPASQGRTMSDPDSASAGAAAAIFYVDGGPVRYLSDTDAETRVAREGLPIYPGGHIIIVGRKNIADARFSNMQPGSTAMIHVLFYDQVDIIAADMGVIPANVPTNHSSVLNQIHAELKNLRVLTEYQYGLDIRNFHVA